MSTEQLQAALRSDGRYKTSFSELDAFRQCPLKWWARYALRLQSPGSKPALERGSAWHEILEAHYQVLKDGGELGDCVEALAPVLGGIQDRLGYDVATLLLWMYQGYIDYYGDDKDWEILAIEHAFDTPLAMYNPALGGPKIELVMGGKIDLVARDRMKRTWVWDHKTKGNKDASGAAWSRDVQLEDQFGIYQKALNESQEFGPIFGVIYAVARTDKLKRAMTDTERFARHKTFRGEQELEALWKDAATTAAQMLRVLETGEGLYSSPDADRCGWRCDALEPHLLSRSSGRPFEDTLLQFNWTKRRDYRDRTGPEEAIARIASKEERRAVGL